MKPSTRLSSAVFQLTPTRTRCDLIIIANDKKEKIASGLLNPFLAHLKTAQDQIAKGGYSILLEVENNRDATWFTKATLERFVRFVSTPEILERVYTIETEILQIEEAISMQSNNDIGQSIVDEHQGKPLRGFEGNNSVSDANEEKSIVLYKPGPSLPEANGSLPREENSKVQLLKVLETRKTVLQKEQGMAFARAVAAGFDIDQMAPLASFAECFGAARLMEACSRFMNLWNNKHETGQWLEIETTEALPTRSELSATNGLILSATANRNDESNPELASESNGKSGLSNNADNPVPNVPQEYFPGQFPHLVFPPWPMHSPNGAQPVFQPYPLVQRMPYYHPYSGNGPFFPPPHHPMYHSPSNFDAEVLDSRKPRKKKSNKKQSAKTVVIRNVNYITSKEKDHGSESNSGSSSDTDTENENLDDGSSENKGNHTTKSVDNLNFKNEVSSSIGNDTGFGNWEAFQNCLLRESDDTDKIQDSRNIRRVNRSGDDDVLFSRRNNDSRRNGDHQMDIHISEANGKNILYTKSHEDFVTGIQRNPSNFRNSLDVNVLEGPTKNLDREYSSHDETFIVPFRSMSLDQTAIDLDYEIPLANQKGKKNKINYEPDDLSLMPERGLEKRPIGYDPALDYEMQVRAGGSREKGEKEITDPKGGLVRKLDKDKRAIKASSESLSKQRSGSSIRKGKVSKTSPLEDARARAEKLRLYKADLQKLKKEKEEAEMKRLETLKLKRQNRIATRGSSSTLAKPQSTLSPQTNQSQVKLSRPINRGSKFSDTDPESSSPLQRSKIKTSIRSNEPLQASKATNRLTRSSSSLSEPKREINGVNSRTSTTRIRRLSEPKTITNSSVNSTKARSVESVSKQKMSEGNEKNKISAITNSFVNSTKARSVESVSKRKMSEGNEKNKISAILNLDKSKAATLPELKIKTSKPLFNEVHQINVDDNPIVEKTVVMLEYEKPSLPTLQQHGDNDRGEKSNLTSDKNPGPCQPQRKSDSNEAMTSYLKDTTEKPYHAPHARMSSLEDPCTAQSMYGKAPLISSDPVPRVEETVKVLDPDVKTLKKDKNRGISDKTSIKEPSSGLRRLLKFGKKNHTSSSADQSVDLDCASGDGFSCEVRTLRNLISHDESSTAGSSSQKSSSHFSLLSPFRRKTSEKKQES